MNSRVGLGSSRAIFNPAQDKVCVYLTKSQADMLVNFAQMIDQAKQESAKPTNKLVDPKSDPKPRVKSDSVVVPVTAEPSVKPTTPSQSTRSGISFMGIKLFKSTHNAIHPEKQNEKSKSANERTIGASEYSAKSPDRNALKPISTVNKPELATNTRVLAKSKDITVKSKVSSAEFPVNSGASVSVKSDVKTPVKTAIKPVNAVKTANTPVKTAIKPPVNTIKSPIKSPVNPVKTATKSRVKSGAAGRQPKARTTNLSSRPVPVTSVPRAIRQPPLFTGTFIEI